MSNGLFCLDLILRRKRERERNKKTVSIQLVHRYSITVIDKTLAMTDSIKLRVNSSWKEFKKIEKTRSETQLAHLEYFFRYSIKSQI
ncbi:hypothetical protein BpHYR1_010840 [Brachionus plicatilis]|uniref:Uncharacterized protein n=1 Tax=Brachionus plicatilis TaxID=10195 RepID=A0A3M7RVV7_BRAPC|nr:hypothetical protein BpHYR1_010840 [Brachionus plicatilis]